jgi:hypothetical protein
MDYIATWQCPIDLAAEAAFTYGLVSTELVEAEWPPDGFPQRLLDRFGLRLLEATANDFRDQRHEPAVVEHAQRVRELVKQNLAPLVLPISAAADAAHRVGDADSDVPEPVLRLVELWGPRVSRPARLRTFGSERTRWGRTYEHLLDRAALEIFELYATHARLRRCRYCGSAFVPRRDERVCRANIWPRTARLGDAPLRRCSPERDGAATPSEEAVDQRLRHKRERKRLWAAYARARDAARERGSTNPEADAGVKRAHQELQTYLANSGVRRGRPRPDDVFDISPDDHNA